MSAGERYARIYEINMSRCIFCGYCELACPFDAITLGNEFEISEYNRDDLIYTKDMLLAEPIKRVPVQDQRERRQERVALHDDGDRRADRARARQIEDGDRHQLPGTSS